MSSTSTIPGTLDALEDLLVRAFATANPEGNPVQVTQGPPRDPQRERIEITDVANAPQDWETLGGLVNRNEQYLINCWVLISDPRYKTFRDCKNRAFELLGIVEDALRVNDPLNLVASYNYFEVDFGGVVSTAGVPSAEAWVYELGFTVRVEATI